MRPALVWGWTRNPSRSSATISERTVAEDTCTPGEFATWEEPTGSAVPMYSVTTASKMAARLALRARSSPATSANGTESEGGVMGCLALKSTECQDGTRGREIDGQARVGRLTSSQSSPRRKAEMKASWGTSTRPMFFIFFLPSFCFSRSLRLRLMSPP